MEQALGTKARIHVGEEPPQGEAPSAVIFSSNGEGVVQEIRRLRVLAPEVPILVFSPSGNDLRLAEEALRAGASGFFYAGMQPERIVLALSSASKEEVLIPRELLGRLLGRRFFQRLPKFLDP
jgi:DNA-binding NarL/FixJ family response regulator